MKPAANVDQLRPMQAPEATVVPFTDKDWVYEIKYDGYRTLASFGGESDQFEDRKIKTPEGVQLRTKTGKVCTHWYSEVADVLASLKGGPTIIDGEACCVVNGVSDFNRSQERVKHRRWYGGCPQVTLCAFDILVHNGKSVMDLPLLKRKAILEKLLADVPKRALMFVGDLPAEAELYEAVLGLKLESFMAKKKDSLYTSGQRSFDWRKICKRPGWQEGRTWVNR